MLGKLNFILLNFCDYVENAKMQSHPCKKTRRSSIDEGVEANEDDAEEGDVKDFDTTRAQEAARVFFRHVACGSIHSTNKRIAQLERMVTDLRKRVSFFEAFVPPCSWPQNFSPTFVDHLINHKEDGDRCGDCRSPTSCIMTIRQLSCVDEHFQRQQCGECEGNYCEDHIQTCENDSVALCEDCFREHAPRCDACRSLL